MSYDSSTLGVGTADSLFAKARRSLGVFDIHDFAIYSIEDKVTRLAFSCGGTASAEPSSDSRFQVPTYPGLHEVLRGEAFVARNDEAEDDEPTQLFLTFAGAAAMCRMAVEDKPVGFILVFGSIPRSLGAQPDHELGDLIGVLARLLAKHRAVDEMQRKYLRASAKLRELQEGLDILLLRDRDSIFAVVLQRALDTLGSRAGMLWLRSAQGWNVEHTIGSPPLDFLDACQRLVHDCWNTNRPGLLSSISGEETWEFDVETIHIAAIAVFPLRARARIIGCIVAFDATVSLDLVDTVEATGLVGGTAIENWLNARRMLEQQRITEQMSLAAKTQKRLLPAKAVQVRGLAVAHYSRYCDETGGDYIDVIPSGQLHRCAFVVGDVSGHGLGAAMLMVDVRARLRTCISHQPGWSPEEVLTEINDVLCQESDAAEFVTLFLAVLDSRTGLLRYASAGHEPPLLLHADTQQWSELESTGLPLGVESGARYAAQERFMGAGDILVVSTDGAVEARNTGGIPFGNDSIQRVVQSYQKNDVETVLAVLIERTLQHCQPQAFADDVTYLLIKAQRLVLRVQEQPPPMPGNPTYEERFPATRPRKDECLRRVRDILEARYGVDKLGGVLMAIGEVVTNAVVHGNHEDENKEIRLRLWCGSQRVALSLDHDGDAFEPRRCLPREVDQDSLRMESGRGLLIMTSMMDEVIYWNRGRGVYMRATLESIEPQPDWVMAL